MNKKATKLTLAIMLTAIMIFIAACGNNTNGNNEDPGTTPATPGTNAPEAPPADVTVDFDAVNDPALYPPMGKYEPAIELTTVSRIPGADLVYSDGFSADDTMWTRLYEDTLGIKLRDIWKVEDSQYTTRIGIAIATGKIPDVMQINISQLTDLMKGDMIQDITDAYNKYASPLTRATLAIDNGQTLKGAMIDGKLMGVPLNNDFSEKTNFLWIRQDWLDNLGLQAPKTREEFLAVATAFAKNDPDKDGVADTYGITFTGNGLFRDHYGFASFFSMFDAHMLSKGLAPFMVEKDGKLEWSGLNPGMKTALESAAQLYKDGAIVQDFATVDGNRLQTDIAAGNVGMVFGAHHMPFWQGQQDLNKLKIEAGEPIVEWLPVPVPGADGPAMQPVHSPVFGLMVVRKGYEHPEALIKAWNLFNEMYFGELNTAETAANYFRQEDTEAEKRRGGIVTAFKKPFFNLYDVWEPAVAALNGEKDPATLIGAAKSEYDSAIRWQTQKFGPEDEPAFDWATYRWLGPDGKGPFSVVKDLMEADKYILQAMEGPVPGLVFQDYDILQKGPLTSTVAEIIAGRLAVSEWDNFVENQWKPQGGQAQVDNANAWYQSIQ